MKKAYVLNLAFLAVEIIALIPLAIEIFGDMDPDVITISAIFFGVGLIGSCVCAVVRAVYRLNKTAEHKNE